MSTAGGYRLRMALLIAALTCAYLAGNGRVPLFDRDESRYALTSRAMLESGDWVVPRLMDRVRTAKPPAAYWLQAAAMRVFGFDEFAVRLPGAVACAATLVLLAAMLPPLVGRRRAAWSCFTLGTSVLVLGVAKVGVTDGILLLCVTAMQVALLRMVRGYGHEWMNATLLWVAVGFGGLVKGPVILGVLGTTLLSWVIFQWRRAAGSKQLVLDSDVATHLFRKLHVVWGTFILALVCGPWIVLIVVREPGFIVTALSHDIATRSVRGLEGHGQPPGFHLLALFGTWFPWSVILPATIIAAWQRRRDPVIRFALAGAFGPWLMFEIVVTKLPHYLLVIFPMLALLTGDWIVRALRRLRVRGQPPWGVPAAALIGAVVAVGFACAPIALGAYSVPASAIALSWATVLLLAWLHRRLRLALLTAGSGMALVVAVAYLDWLGRVPLLTVSQRTAAALHALGAQQAGMLHYREPSLAWYGQPLDIRLWEVEPSALNSGAEFLISTRRDWESLGEKERARWTVQASIPARLYNEQLLFTEVLVVRRVERPPNTTRHTDAGEDGSIR